MHYVIFSFFISQLPPQLPCSGPLFGNQCAENHNPGCHHKTGQDAHADFSLAISAPIWSSLLSAD